jgi:hypothetical protein
MEPSQRTGVCMIRIWVEDEASELRARLIMTLDITGAEEQTVSAAGADAIGEAVRGFLERFEAQARS